MSATKIEWTDATWNPVTGCSPVSAGCRNCYAARMAKRLRGRAGYPADDPFRVTLHPDKLDAPLHWRKPRRVFVCSMGDLFHDDVPFDFLDQIFAVMALTPQHTYQLLTKRPERMKAYLLHIQPENEATGMPALDRYERVWSEMTRSLGGYNYSKPEGWPLPNVWEGITAENQETADERIPVLLQTPAAVRFVSVEPMLGPVDVSPYLEGSCLPREHDYDDSPVGYVPCAVCDGFMPLHESEHRPGLDWVIVGGETGPGARPMHPDWVRKVRDDCQAAGVPFFFKGWGAWATCPPDNAGNRRMVLLGQDGRTYGEGQGREGWADPDAPPGAKWLARLGPKLTGRQLDGREHNEYPKETKR